MTYRTATRSCPACNGLLEAGDPGQLVCRSCEGVHVTPDTMVELLRGVAPDIEFHRSGVLAFPQPFGTPRRRCPHCGKQMIAAVLFEIAIDQCIDDGIWFDRHELQNVLDNARERYVARGKL